MRSVVVNAVIMPGLLPNPSLKRTSTGWPLRAPYYLALRGQPATAA
jgi:hypothetical protein